MSHEVFKTVHAAEILSVHTVPSNVSNRSNQSKKLFTKQDEVYNDVFDPRCFMRNDFCKKR